MPFPESNIVGMRRTAVASALGLGNKTARGTSRENPLFGTLSPSPNRSRQSPLLSTADSILVQLDFCFKKNFSLRLKL